VLASWRHLSRGVFVVAGALGGLEPILAASRSSADEELQSQVARALRNLTCNTNNKARVRALGGVQLLEGLTTSTNDRIRQQATRALNNLTADAGNASVPPPQS
jgi:hypothetical protein